MRETAAIMPEPVPKIPAGRDTGDASWPPPPRARMMGGDVPRGGELVGVGHAGRPPVLHPLLSLLMAMMLLLAGSLAINRRPAHAETVITFANGGTATLNADGSIDGSCEVQRSTDFALYRDGDPNDPGPSVPTPFHVTMPDGQHIVAYCKDGENYAPRNGSIPFTAYPKGSSYEVWVWGNRVEANAAEIAAWNAAGRGLFFPPQRLFASSWNPSIQGDIALAKTSSDTLLSSISSAYSLAGAVYGIYSDEGCTSEVARVTTDASGRARSGKLDAGAYWIKEVSPSPGFALDGRIHKLDVSAGKTADVSVTEEPQYQPISLLLTKVDALTGKPSPQGSASLEGARFLVRFFGNAEGDISGSPARSWIFASDAAGKVLMDSAHLESGDELYTDEEGGVMLPLGTLAVQEISAPAGYFLEGQASIAQDPYDAPVHVIAIPSSGTARRVDAFQAPTIPEEVKRAGLSIDKDDDQTVLAQGDATLAGFVFEVINRSEHEVVVDGARFDPGDVVTTLVTDSDGCASTEPDLLPLGTYEVREATPGAGYLDTSLPQTIELTVPETIHCAGEHYTDSVIRGGVRVGKLGAETSDSIAQGGATLAGARFTITSLCASPVLVDGAVYQPGAIVATLVTDESGTAELGADALPYGRYLVREVEAPAGYLPNDDWSQEFAISEDGEIVDLAGSEFAAPDQVKRGGLSFNKVDEGSMEEMPLVAFLVTAQDDPDGDGVFEQHVIVTDENGAFDSELALHTYRTNANDAAYDPETGLVDDAALDPEAGIWFSGRTDRTTDPADGRGALPYGSYTVQELACAGNADHTLVSFSLHISRDGRTVDRGTVDDKPAPLIFTELSSDAGKVVPAAEGPVVLTDRVHYANLEPGTAYLFAGELVDGGTGEHLGIAASKETVVYAPAGTIDLEFAVDPSVIAARRIVAFEELWLDGACIAEHKDLEDAGQTVTVPSIGTTLASAEGGKVASSARETVALVDTVAYAGLWPSESYRIQGELVDGETGELLGISAAAGFAADAPDGTVEVRFDAPPEILAGKTVVCFETLYRDDHALAIHADLDDAGQTVMVPALATSLASEAGDKTVADPSGTIVLIDTVSYRGLEAGSDYALEGELVDKDTREVLAQTSASFCPEASAGAIEMTFELDAESCRGRQLVAFEKLVSGDAVLASHADPNDEGQTVRFAEMRTTLAGAGGETATVIASSPTILIDTVSFRGLTPGQEYLVKGTLMDKATGEPLGIDAEATFIAEAPSGSVDVVFECDGSMIAGKDVVAFEKMLHDGTELLVHADLEDEDQTIAVPRIRTRLVDSPGGRKTVEKGSFALVDTVQYEGLVPGTRYIVRGRLFDKATGKPFLDAKGREMVGEVLFTPETRCGTVDIAFRVDTTHIDAACKLVAFESVQEEDGPVVAVHEDIDDAEQTVEVTIPESPKPSRVPRTGDDNDPLSLRIAAIAGGAIAVVSTLVSIRTGSAGQSAKSVRRRGTKRRYPDSL